MNKPAQLTSITPLLEAVRCINRSKSTYYDMQNPKSARYDPDLPVPFKIGRSTFVVTEELEQYIQKKIATRRAPETKKDQFKVKNGMHAPDSLDTAENKLKARKIGFNSSEGNASSVSHADFRASN
ncbi:hypothetical protein [Paraburkholderia metrosideri]|uniref:AlpA family phage regulatory protein n=1 Tax=Paraburkholderia metrosideri TaxID=580937 RepID=A0ABM8P5Q0_9BURK|nr:hypothetical protein [Paraburkholderia metrosideri]CAD6557020.1 hypothetical protein LMG28140_06041 [Paraburkholderia metrosideri]